MTSGHMAPDRAVDVAQGKARWSADEAAHLVACAECRAEWELTRATAELGKFAVMGLDSHRIAAAVERRLVREPGPARPVARWALKGIGALAAAAVLIVVLNRLGPTVASPQEEPLAVLHELDGLTTSQLEAVLESIPISADSSIHVESATMDELSAQELERVLRSLE